jgi:integrase
MGFRASEPLSLTWQDVDFKRGVVTARAGYAKNGEARSVPTNDTLTMLLKFGKLHAADRERVFCNRHGQPYRSFRTAFEHAVRQAGMQDFTFHDLH